MLYQITILLFETFLLFILLSGFQVPLFCLIHFPMMDFLRDPEIPAGTLNLTKHTLGSQMCTQFQKCPSSHVNEWMHHIDNGQEW